MQNSFYTCRVFKHIYSDIHIRKLLHVKKIGFPILKSGVNTLNNYLKETIEISKIGKFLTLSFIFRAAY